jgi:hypothetical protein
VPKYDSSNRKMEFIREKRAEVILLW